MDRRQERPQARDHGQATTRRQLRDWWRQGLAMGLLLAMLWAAAGSSITTSFAVGETSGTAPSGPPSGGGGRGGGGGGGGGVFQPPPGTGTVNPSDGGTVSLGDLVTLTIPDGALLTPGALSVAIAVATVPNGVSLPEGFFTGSAIFTIDLKDITGNLVKQFAQGLELTVPYREADLRMAGGDPSRLSLYRFDDATRTWQALPTTVDPSRHTLRAVTTRTSLFAIMVDLPTPAGLAGPRNGMVYGLETVLAWTNPDDTAQYHVQIVPYNDDGPALNMIIGRPDLVQAARFQVPAPVLGQGNYIMLPGMGYTWRVRTSPVTTPLGEDDSGWSKFVSGGFRTSWPTSLTISPVGPMPMSTVGTRTPTLQWANANTSIFYYEVLLSKDPAFVVEPAQATAAVYWNLVHGGETSPLNSWTVPPSYALESGMTYYWKVRPRVQGDGTPVDWSDIWSFQTP